MTQKISRAKTARTRSMTRDLRPKKTATVKGGYGVGFVGGVRVATGDVNSDDKAAIITKR